LMRFLRHPHLRDLDLRHLQDPVPRLPDLVLHLRDPDPRRLDLGPHLRDPGLHRLDQDPHLRRPVPHLRRRSRARRLRSLLEPGHEPPSEWVRMLP
jgi:hypothetical protein